jgi:hypothetical protein
LREFLDLALALETAHRLRVRVGAIEDVVEGQDRNVEGHEPGAVADV